VCLVVGSLLFLHSGGGGHSSLLLSSSGGGWSFGMVAVWHGVMARCRCCAAVVVGTIGWGGRSLSLCWVGCHTCLVVGWLPFLCSSGGGWSFGVVAIWHGGCHGSLPLSCSGGGAHRWVGWSLVVIVLVVLLCAPGCGLVAVFVQWC